jgi:hypothetical protein
MQISSVNKGESLAGGSSGGGPSSVKAKEPEEAA